MSDEQCDLDAERNILGAVLLAPDVFIDCAAILRPDDFYRPAHETIWSAISAQAASQEPIDPALIVERLRSQGDLYRVGGAEYIHTVIASTPSAANATYYARIVHRYGGVRRIMSAAVTVEGLARSASATHLDDLRQRAQSAIDAAVDDDTPSGGWVHDRFTESLDALTQDARLLPSPWSSLDNLIGGLGAGRLIVIGARPGVGKTVVATEAAMHVAQQPGWGAAFVSLEMGEQELHMRMLARLAEVPHDRIERRMLNDMDWDDIAGVTDQLATLPLNILDSGHVRPADIWHYVRSLQRRQPIGLVVVDYLQLMTSIGDSNRSRAEVVGEFSRQLKLMAKDLGVCVMACSQLNRASLSRRDNSPSLADLRESGAIEQDADAVVLLHRDIDGAEPENMKFIVAKNRHGGTGHVQMNFSGRYQRVRQTEWTPHDALDAVPTP